MKIDDTLNFIYSAQPTIHPVKHYAWNRGPKKRNKLNKMYCFFLPQYEQEHFVFSTFFFHLHYYRILQIATGSYYMIGGGIYDSRGFIGCMRQIRIDGNYKLPIGA